MEVTGPSHRVQHVENMEVIGSESGEYVDISLVIMVGHYS
jgi:hypothetical protein